MTMELRDKGDRWRCFVRGCRTAENEFGLRKYTWLDGSHVLFIYCWSKEMMSIEFCKTELGLSSKTAVDWSNFLLEVCAADLLANPVVLGGLRSTNLSFRGGKITRGGCYQSSGCLVADAVQHASVLCLRSPIDLGPPCCPSFSSRYRQGQPSCPICGRRMTAYKPWALPITSKSHLQFRGPANRCAHTEH